MWIWITVRIQEYFTGFVICYCDSYMFIFILFYDSTGYLECYLGCVLWYFCVFIFICLSCLSIMYFVYDFNNK